MLVACGSGPSTEHAVPVVAEHAVPAAGQAVPVAAEVTAEQAATRQAGDADQAGAAPAAKTVETLAQVRDDVPLALPKLLGRSQAEIEAMFGAPVGKGMDRKSCVRFVPERVFFACKYALRPHADKTGTFEEVLVAYEDGVVTELTFDGLKAGSGPFDPQALLGAIGLTLPEPGKQSVPASKVRLWSWFNSLARLRIAGKEYRVEVSVVEEDWSRGRVTIYENDRLTPEQTAKIVPPAGGAAISEPPAK
jgi:hypothetical protein